MTIDNYEKPGNAVIVSRILNLMVICLFFEMKLSSDIVIWQRKTQAKKLV